MGGWKPRMGMWTGGQRQEGGTIKLRVELCSACSNPETHGHGQQSSGSQRMGVRGDEEVTE